MGKNKWLIVFASYCIIICSSQFFNYVYWKDITNGYDRIYYVLYPLVLLGAVLSRNRIKGRLEYGRIVTGICFVGLLCLIPIMFRGYGLSREIPYILIPMAIMLYYLYLAYDVREETVLRCLTIIGLIVFGIQVIQNLFPSSAVFGIFDPDSDNYYTQGELANQRNGIWRYILTTPQITVFCLCYWYIKLLERLSIRNLVLFIAFAMSTYLYMTRQIIFAVLVSILLFSFARRTRGKRFSKWLPILLALIIVLFFSPLLGNLISMTREGGVSTEYRMEAFVFYGRKILSSFISFFLGSGHPALMEAWQDIHLHTSDIGFVGEVYHKGILQLVLYLVLVYRLLLKNKSVTPPPVRLYVLCSFMFSITAFPYRSGLEYVLWAIILYLSENQYRINQAELCKS